MVIKETFSQNVKEEICSLTYSKEEMLPLLSGFIKVNGVLTFNGKTRTLVLKTENSKVAKLIYNFLKVYFQIPLSFKYSQKMKLNKKVVYHLFVDQKVDEILKILEIRDGIISTYPKNLVHDKNLPFFLAGAFLASGSVNSPKSKNYHLQLSFAEKEDAKFVIRLLNKFKDDNNMDFKMIEHRSKYVIYIKKADQISTFLSIIGAQNQMYEFENERIMKDFINSDNRYAICLAANMNKTKEKSDIQIAEIKYIYEHNGELFLNEKEKALCELRLKYNEASLMQLSELLRDEYDIVISKSGVNHLFKSIHEKKEQLVK